MCYLRFSNCGFDEQLENRNSERKVLYSLHFTDPHPFSFSSKYQKIWHNRECREAHLTKLSLKSCWKKLGGNISWHHQVSIRSVMALKQAWTPLDKWQFQILTLVTDAAEDIKRNMPSSCIVHLLMTILFVCQKITCIGGPALMMLPISTLGKVEALIILSITQPRFLPFSFIQKAWFL